MQIISITPRGYCKGVVNAINIAKQCSLDYPNQPITILGMIVHNDYVTRALEHLNIKTLETKGKMRIDLLDEIESGVVIFTAHGINPKVKEKAKKKGLICIDASCPDVLTTQQRVAQMLDKNYHVFYLGKKGHPEAEAVITTSNNITLIDSMESIEKLNVFYPRLFLTTQTTMSILETSEMIKTLQIRYPHIEIEEEICNATRIRQEALLKVSDIDLLYVVGDQHSNNTNQLKNIALSNHVKSVKLIETCSQINEQDLVSCKRIAITSGASTPTYLTNQVINVLKNYAETSKLIIPDVDINAIL